MDVNNTKSPYLAKKVVVSVHSTMAYGRSGTLTPLIMNLGTFERSGSRLCHLTPGKCPPVITE
jgi:hypothetical protein